MCVRVNVLIFRTGLRNVNNIICCFRLSGNHNRQTIVGGFVSHSRFDRFDNFKMFLEKIDWDNPRFGRWNLRNLAPLNKAQQDAFFEDDVSFIESQHLIDGLKLTKIFYISLFLCTGSWFSRFQRSGIKSDCTEISLPRWAIPFECVLWRWKELAQTFVREAEIPRIIATSKTHIDPSDAERWCQIVQ